MREIKFRTWNGNEMFHTDHGDIGPTGKNKYEWSPYCFVIENQPDPPNVEDWVVMQYTGLKDKNGREIYEGDILKGKIYGEIGIFVVEYDVTWEGNSWPASGFIIEMDSLLLFDKDKAGYMPIINGKIIGNIYENPELLKKEA